MSRKQLKTEPVTNEVDKEKLFEHMITTFYENKTQSDSFKKIADSYNKDIKQYMMDNNMDNFEGKELQASITVTPKQDFNELRAIEILRENLTPELFNQAVKTKEYIDNDALEQLTYNNVVDVGILSPCITQKNPVITLRVKKVKK